MIYTALYLSPFLRGNINRNIYMYAIGTCLYAIVHCILFSSIGENTELIKKYRNLLYLVLVGDLMYIKYTYNSELSQLRQQIRLNSKPPVPDTHIPVSSPTSKQNENPNVTQPVNIQAVTLSKGLSPFRKSNGLGCAKDALETVTHDVHSEISLPTYKPKENEHVNPDVPEPVSNAAKVAEDVELPVFG